MLAQKVYPISIKDDQALIRKTFDQQRKKAIHICVSTQSWSYNPSMNSWFPSKYLLEPVCMYDFQIDLIILNLSLRDEYRMNYYLRWIWFYRGWSTFRTKYVSQIAPYLQRTDGWIEGCSCELKRAPDHSNSTIIAFFGSSEERRKNWFKEGKKLFGRCQHS